MGYSAQGLSVLVRRKQSTRTGEVSPITKQIVLGNAFALVGVATIIALGSIYLLATGPSNEEVEKKQKAQRKARGFTF